MSRSDSNATKCRCVTCLPPGPTYSEAHRAACEARWVAALPTHGDRRAYLERVARRRGQAAADRLRQAAWGAMR